MIDQILLSISIFICCAILIGWLPNLMLLHCDYTMHFRALSRHVQFAILSNGRASRACTETQHHQRLLQPLQALPPTSAVLMSIYKHIRHRCAKVNRAYEDCKKKDKNPATCIEEGLAVSRCAADL